MIPMVDLKKQFREIKDELFDVLTEILESSHYILGSKVSELEKKIAEYAGLEKRRRSIRHRCASSGN